MAFAAAYRATAVLLALGALCLLLASGPGTRLGWWHFGVGFALLRWGAYAGGAAAALALVALAWPRLRARSALLWLVLLAVGGAALALPLRFQQEARAAPPIHDITTDTADPPAFVALLARRAGAPNPPGHAGEAVAAQQRKAYPDIRPAVLAVPVPLAYARALDAVQGLGWELVAADAEQGRIEATATTFWFGFKDDVVIRVMPAPTSGSRVDARSKSRVGRGDAGANAARLREFLARVRAA